MLKQVTHMMMVRDFHEKYGHPINEKMTDKKLNKRFDLITEEYLEVEDEIDYKLSTLIKTKVDKQALTKELADLLYVVYGTAVAFGLPIELVFRRTHLSNMTKSEEKDKNGKTKKGRDYEPPVLRDLFE